MAIGSVHANHDLEACVWYTIDGDIHGLVVGAETIELLAVEVGNTLPDLLKIHAENFTDNPRLVGPHSIRIQAFHERTFDVAAEANGSRLH